MAQVANLRDEWTNLHPSDACVPELTDPLLRSMMVGFLHIKKGKASHAQ